MGQAIKRSSDQAIPDQAISHFLNIPSFKKEKFGVKKIEKFGVKNSGRHLDLHLDGAPIASKSNTHPSHSQTSRQLTSSLSLSVPVRFIIKKYFLQDITMKF